MIASAPLPLLLADISWSVLALAAAFIFICIFMMLVVLIQKPKGGGLSGAFGGAGGGESSFVGAKVGDFLTYLTVGCFIAFLLLAMCLTWAINPTENRAVVPAAAGATQQDEQDGETPGEVLDAALRRGSGVPPGDLGLTEEAADTPPEAPETPEAPEAQETPETPAPEAPTPDVPDTPDAPDTPDVPAAP